MHQLPYRPDIDGLRAVAVVAVALFHADLGCPGGYVGVDVFFVISGYLITSLIWKDLEADRFTFAQFWERRARRILPALVVAVLITLAAGWFLLLPDEYAGLGRAAAVQAFFAANIYYWRDTGYFAGGVEEKPLLHTWSLAVEEQFYFLVPVLLWVLFRSAGIRGRSSALALLGTLMVASFGLSVYGVAHHPSPTFYLLPTRAWELLLGAVIAFLPVPPARRGGRGFRQLLSLIGLVLIAVPVLFYTPRTPFPGFAALAPCAGAGLLIWSNANRASTPTAVGALLGLRPLVLIGLVSYSFYLYHWPLLALGTYLSPGPLAVGPRVALLGAGLMLAMLSWKFVETPFRKRQLGATRGTMFRIAGAGLAAVLVWGTACAATRGFPRRFPQQVVELAAAAREKGFISNLTLGDVRAGRLVQLGVASPMPPQLLVWGDSHAMAALPAVEALLKETGVAGRAATSSNTAPVLDWYRAGDGLGVRAPDFNEAVYQYTRRARIPDVLLIARWSHFADGNGMAGPGRFDEALVATVQRLAATGCRPWVVLDVPLQPFHVPRALALAAVDRRDLALRCARPDPGRRFDGLDPGTILRIQSAGGRLLDPKPLFLDPSGRFYRIRVDGITLYRDSHHLTPRGAVHLLLPFLREAGIVPGRERDARGGSRTGPGATNRVPGASIVSPGRACRPRMGRYCSII